MKFSLIVLFIFSLLNADEFAIFDESAEDVESSFKVEKAFIDVELKLNYQFNEPNDDEKVLFLNLKKDEENYLLDMRLVANDDKQNLLIKELYFKDGFLKYHHYKVGRMNIKEGYAKGYNPTDYFRANSSITLSSNPKEIKDNRLGSLAISSTSFLDNYVLKAIYSPKITADKNSFFSDKEHMGLYLDETNNQDRTTLSLAYNGVENLSSIILLHYNDDGLNIGLDLSYIYSSFIFYFESSFKEKDAQIDKITMLQRDYDYVNQTSVGFTYTSDLNIVTSLEYIYNSLGLDKDEWDKLLPEFSLQRLKYSKSNSILSKESIFLFSRSSDVFVNLDASFLIWLNPYDKSNITQIGIEYALNDNIQTNIFAKNYMGDDDTQYGSLQNDYEILLEFKYFF